MCFGEQMRHDRAVGDFLFILLFESIAFQKLVALDVRFFELRAHVVHVEDFLVPFGVFVFDLFLGLRLRGLGCGRAFLPFFFRPRLCFCRKIGLRRRGRSGESGEDFSLCRASREASLFDRASVSAVAHGDSVRGGHIRENLNVVCHFQPQFLKKKRALM